MNYHRETGQVQYRSKDGKETKVIDALEWLAAMCAHVPNKGEQMARYYGFYSNVARGKRIKTDADGKIPCFLEPELTGKTLRRNWARLIQKIYYFQPILANCRVDITIFILYMGLYWISRLGLAAASAAAQYVVTHPQPSHNPVNLDFLLDPLSKSEFLSFILEPH